MYLNISNRVATPTIALFAFTFVVQFVSVLYSAREAALPALFEFLNQFASIGFICWWIRDDSRRAGVSWPLDLGMFLFAAWPVIVPYHLFKTRGLRGSLGILAFIGIHLAAWLVAVAVAIILWF
jgi:hypothetical protein